MGDVVHALPAVSDLARRHRGASIDWVVEDLFAEIPRMHRDVYRVIPIGLRRWGHPVDMPSNRKENQAARPPRRPVQYARSLDTHGPGTRTSSGPVVARA